ncbi:MAG: 3-dehydroquinate synthase [Sulfolobus sp.]|nr:3-dehydroquinate synthase [Sulfolobus sp.]
MNLINETIGTNNVEIIIGRGALNRLREINENKVILRSKSVNLDLNYLLKGEKFLEIEIPDGEEAKSFDNVVNIIDKLISNNIKRNHYIVAIGGGTVTDVAGFVASVYMRGLKLVNVPTTLLGMVDASIGGKNAINFKNVKNILGTFYQPSLIIDDLSFLDTLSLDEIKKGLAEVIKYALILDYSLYTFLAEHKDAILSKDDEMLENVINRSVENKLNIVKEDEREEEGIRIVLNFGHTIGHAIEAGSGFKIPHGYAISVGMVCEAKMFEELGYAEEGVVEDVIWLLSLYGLPIDVAKLEEKINLNDALNALELDKKSRNDVVLMPTPVRIGEWKKVEVPINVVKGFAQQCLKKEI